MWSVVGAGRGQYSAAAYAASGDGGITQLVEESIVSPEELCEMMAERGENCVLTGEFDELLAELATRQGSGSLVTIAPDVVRARSAANAARLGLQRLSRGDCGRCCHAGAALPAAAGGSGACRGDGPREKLATSHRALSRAAAFACQAGTSPSSTAIIAMMKPKLTISSAHPPHAAQRMCGRRDRNRQHAQNAHRPAYRA